MGLFYFKYQTSKDGSSKIEYFPQKKKILFFFLKDRSTGVSLSCSYSKWGLKLESFGTKYV